MKHLTIALAGACTLFSVAAAATPSNSPWSGRTLHVAVNGLDSTTCGAPTTPCRSISQAITNAATGDTLLVRPGLYGDLNGDGTTATPGEEMGGFFAAVEITKRLRVLSTDGAGSTVIDAHGAKGSVVTISVSGVQLGERGAGFTLIGGQNTGVQNNGETNVVIAGNTVRNIGNREFEGSGQAIYVNVWGVVEVRDNILVDNPSTGLVFAPQNATAYVSAHDNIISGGNAHPGSTGIVVGGGNPHLVYRNLISDNSIGLVVNYGAARIFNNLVTGNGDGVQVDGVPTPVPARGPSFTRNTFSANKNYGFYVTHFTLATVTIRENNFFGNVTNCGIASQSADTVIARNNFWGASTGPSAVDPADEACVFQGSVVTTPFATREFDIK